MILLWGIALIILLLTFILTQESNVIIKIVLLLLLAVLVSIAFLIWAGPPVRSPDQSWYEIAPWRQILLITTTLFGMVSNYLLEYFQARIKAKESKGKVKMPKFVWEKIALPFIIAILVFGYFWEQHGKEPMNFAIMLISFQNGFFWQTVLEKVKG